MAATRGGIDRAALAELVERGLSTRQIAAELDRCQATVKHWLRSYGLQTRPSRGRQLVGKYATDTCPTHGEVRFVLEGRGYYRCVRCRSEQVSDRRRRIKEILVHEHGGRCVRCGYDRYIGALEFHHRDPAGKSFDIATRGLTRSLERARAEAAKCDLLCSNCHAEVEAGFAGATLDGGCEP